MNFNLNVLKTEELPQEIVEKTDIHKTRAPIDTSTERPIDSSSQQPYETKTFPPIESLQPPSSVSAQQIDRTIQQEENNPTERLVTLPDQRKLSPEETEPHLTSDVSSLKDAEKESRHHASHLREGGEEQHSRYHIPGNVGVIHHHSEPAENKQDEPRLQEENENKVLHKEILFPSMEDLKNKDNQPNVVPYDIQKTT
jgi:hypothetical protein